MKRKYYIFIAMLILLASCTKEPDLTQENSIPFYFTTGVATRAVIDGEQFAAGDQLAIYLANKIEAETKYAGKKSAYQFNGTEWNVISGYNGLYLYDQIACSRAVYPATATYDRGTHILTPTHIASLDMQNIGSYVIGDGGSIVGLDVVKISKSEIDYMTGLGAADEELSSTGTKASVITMRHSMAMVAVRLNKGTTYFDKAVMSDFSINNTSTGVKPLKSGTINILDNSFTPGTTEVSYARNFTGCTTSDLVGFLAYPAVIAIGNINISVTVDGSKYTTTNKNNIFFETGKLTIINITISTGKIEITSAPMVNGWPDIATERKVDLE